MLASTVVSVLQTIKQLFSLDSHLLLNPGYLVLFPGVSLHFGIYRGQWQSTLPTGTPAVPSSSHPSPFFLSFQCQLWPFQKNLFQDWKLKRHPGVLGRTKVNMSLKIISNIIILQTLKENSESSTVLLPPETESILNFLLPMHLYVNKFWENTTWCGCEDQRKVEDSL